MRLEFQVLSGLTLPVFLSVHLQLWESVVMCFCCRVLNVLGLSLSKLNLTCQESRGNVEADCESSA